MKMTMHIDEDLLNEVMTATGTTSKTAAVDAALRKVASKFRQRELWKKGLDMTPDELGAWSHPAEPIAKTPTTLLAEDPPSYGSQHTR
jgi:hypothetical protein